MVDSETTVLVTGASGFIGRHLVDALEKTGATILCGTYRGRGFVPTRRAGTSLQQVELDPSGDSGGVALEEFAVDVVFNLAASGVSPRDRDSDDIFDTNAKLLSVLFGRLRRRPPRLVIHSGSWSEYASPEAGMTLTESSPIGPTSSYGAAKVAAAEQGMALSRDLGVSFVNLRLFNVYGPGEAKHRLIPHLVDRLTAKLPVELTSGTQVRDFVHVDDVVRALMLATATELVPYTSYNVCTNEPTRVSDLVRTVARLLDAPERLLRFGALPPRSDEPQWVVGDYSLFKSVTGWEPDIDLSTGVKAFLADLDLRGSHG